jgi:hypothetical protein
MPIVNGVVGVSKFTQEKCNVFGGMMDIHTSVVKGILSRGGCEPFYHYIDLNAGPGIYVDDQNRPVVGSPIIARLYLINKNIPYKMYLIEKDISIYDQLSEHMPTSAVPDKSEQYIYASDCNIVTPEIRFQEENSICHGMVYADSSGQIPPFDLFKKLSYMPRYGRVDFMMTYAATSHKRQIKATACPANERLPELLSKIKKKFWLIREPTGKHQWTFLIGTNWANFPCWNKKGFYGITTKRGQEIYRTIWMTKGELFDI